MKSIDIYTDGACINNGKKNAKAGIGIYISENQKYPKELQDIKQIKERNYLRF